MHFVVELDTTAPQLTFGKPEWADWRCVIPYAVDEPAVAEAMFDDVAMRVSPSALSLAMEPGGGHVSVITRDEVDNEAVWTLRVFIPQAYRGWRFYEPPPMLSGVDMRSDIEL